nr:imelysin family protein [uncultured Celeribacter sp.]
MPLRFSKSSFSNAAPWRVSAFFSATLCSLFALSAPLSADPLQEALERAVDQHTIPAVEAFDTAAGALAETAGTSCLPADLKPGYQTTFDAWMGLQHLHMGPVEANGRILAIAFWPDKKGMIPRALTGMIADEDPVIEDPEEFQHVSIAARGLFALEAMLYDKDFDGYEDGSYACHLTQRIAMDLGRMAKAIDTEWTEEGGFADTLKLAGDAPNPQYLTPMESVGALYTMLTSGLENIKDQRIARPIGTFEKPRPQRAEARRSGRSQRNVVLALEATRDLARKLAPGDMPQTEEAFARTIEMAEALDDPSFARVEDPMQRLKVEIIGQNITTILGHIANEVGAPLGVSAGFNASDGD